NGGARHSVGAAAGDHDRQRAEQDHDVPPQGPVANIPAVKGDPLLVVREVPTANLPQACQTWTNPQINRIVALLVLAQCLMNDRARADQTHVTAKNIDELRQFVDAGDAQKAADSGRARIVLKLSRALPFVARPWLMLEHIIEDLGSIRHHGAKLEALEHPAA